MEIQKILNSQSNLEKEERTGGINLPDFIFKSLIEFVRILLLVYVLPFGLKACGILAT